MQDNILLNKVQAFSVRIVKAEQHLRLYRNEKIMSKQILRAGTSIGANCTEAQNAQSKLDFISKMSIALKEADETRYWLGNLRAGEYLSKEEYESLLVDVKEIIALLVSIIKTTKNNINKKSED